MQRDVYSLSPDTFYSTYSLLYRKYQKKNTLDICVPLSIYLCNFCIILNHSATEKKKQNKIKSKCNIIAQNYSLIRLKPNPSSCLL